MSLRCRTRRRSDVSCSFSFKSKRRLRWTGIESDDRIKRISDARNHRNDDGPVARWFAKAPFIWHRIRLRYHDIRRVMWRIQTHPLHLQQDTRLHPSAAAILYNGKFRKRDERVKVKKKKRQKRDRPEERREHCVLCMILSHLHLQGDN